MARSTKPGQHSISLSPVTSTVELALWRWRQHWFLLLMTGLGIVAAVMIVCAVPLFSEVMLTAGLRNTLTATPTSSEMTLEVDSAGLSTDGVNQIGQQVLPVVPQFLKSYLSGPPEREITTPNFGFISPPEDGNLVSLEAFSMHESASHLSIVQGRLPQTTSQDVEVAITPETAKELHVGVGSVITIQLSYYTQPAVISIAKGSLFQSGIPLAFKLHVVGLFNVKAGDPYWNGEDFQPYAPDNGPSFYYILASDQQLLSTFQQMARSHSVDQVFFSKPSHIYWYYHLAPARISINQLNTLIKQLAATKAFIANNFGDPAMILQSPFMQTVQLSGSVFSTSSTPSSLERFRSQMALANLPSSILALQVILLLLFFVSMMAQLLVDRQAEGIAVLRSRGASNWQVLGSLITQSIVLSLIALIVGPPLAIVAVYFIALRLLPSAIQNAINVISNAPLQALLDIRAYAIITALAAIVAMIFFLYRASRMNVVSAGRRRSLLQRLNLDVIAIIIALAGYGVSLYLGNVQGLLSAQTQALISTPLALIGPIFLLLAVVLLFIRFFPILLRLGSNLAMRMRGAAPMLALAHMARAPRQAVRMTLLLALATAFTIFTLVFVASQDQRSLDIAAYQTGSDFSGNFRLDMNILPLAQQTALYKHIPGVTSASVGYTADASVVQGLSELTAPSIPIEIRAVDPSTFAQTMIWTPVDSSQSLSSLMTQLLAQRGNAIRTTAVPAIVDAYTWNRLGLHVGATFSVNNSATPGDNLHYIAIAEVQNIPTVTDTSAGGVLVDYASLSAVQFQVNRSYLTLNQIWLRTSDDPVSLASVRAALTGGYLQLDNLVDRRMLAGALHSDPLFLDLIGVLILGASAALLLAVAGNLMASWLSVRTRLTNFALLRALGTAPRQIARVLLWEQGIVYAAALLLGIFFGALLAVTVVPALVFTSITPGTFISNNDFYALQQIIPVQLVVPVSLGIAFLVLIAILIVGLVMMMSVILHRSMSQVLRLSEDGRMDFLSREEELVIARSTAGQNNHRRPRRSLTPSLLTLTLWRLRQVRFLLLLTCVGITAAVVIVCAVPLFSTVTTTAGLRTSLTATPTTSEITLDTTTQGLSTGIVQNIQQQFAPIIQHDLANYLGSSTAFTVQGSGFTVVSPAPVKGAYTLNLFGTSIQQAASHINLVQGRLPQAASGEIETILTPETAQSLHVTVGSVITLRPDYYTDTQEMFGGPHRVGALQLHIVGLFNVIPDSFWHGQDFLPVSQDSQTSYTLLVPGTSFLAALDSIAAAHNSNVVFSPQTYELTWRYYLDPSRVNIYQLSNLSEQLYHLQSDIAAKAGPIQNQAQTNGVIVYPYMLQVSLYNPVPNTYQLPATLLQYNNRVAVVNVPIDILSLQIIVLILFFVSLMAGLLVERQTAAIAMLRSRGATTRQVYGFLVMQSIGVGIIALILGPILALIAIVLISQRMLPPAQQDAITLLTAHPISAILGVAWYAVVAVLVAILTMALLLRRAATMDVLALRRETARTTQVPFWQRYRLDVIAAVIALIGYGISLYITGIGSLLDSRAQVLVATPLALVAPIFLLIGLILLFLRFFPYLLAWGATITGRNRGAVSMLALAQVARAPRQVVRMTMLLALATAFAIFTLVFSASQIQYSRDIAAYETGADFSGDLPTSVHVTSLQNITAKYSGIPGVLSATAGYVGEATSSGIAPATTVDIRAVDSSTFANTAIWTSQDSSEPLSSLMAKLAAERQYGVSSAGDVPVIADANAMNRLNLQIGTTFTLQVGSGDFSNLNFVVIDQVQHIPTVNDNTTLGAAGDYVPPAGILVDYMTYSSIYDTQIVAAGGLNSGSLLPINHVWLRAMDDAHSLAQVRAALNTPTLHLDNLNDRYALESTLSNDPLYLDLIIILVIGAITALLLAVIGDLLTSWLNVRTRLTNFAVLRALGASPGQVAGVLTWEQAIVYIAALVLGVVFGALLSLTVVPTLIFTGAPANMTNIDEFYALQHIIPAHIVVPLSLDIVFIVLIIVCIVALGMMARVVLSPSMSQTLRLSED